MGTESQFDPDGMTNVCVGLARQTRADYIKGAQRMLRIYGEILPEKEALKDRFKYQRMVEGSGRTVTRWFYDAWKNVLQDPYSMFSQCTSEEIFNSWNHTAEVRNLHDRFNELYPEVNEIEERMKALHEEKEFRMWILAKTPKEKRPKRGDSLRKWREQQTKTQRPDFI